MNVAKFVNKCKILQSYSKTLCNYTICVKKSPGSHNKINTCINNQVPMVTIFQSYVKSRSYCSNSPDTLVDSNIYEKACDETLDSLCDYFEQLVEDAPHLQTADVTYGSGVLTVNFGSPYGTYVINRQSPNRQIWLSSPTSGPKRYDFVVDRGYWIYKHDSVSLHQLLQEEIKLIVKKDVDFSKCSYSFVER